MSETYRYVCCHNFAPGAAMALLHYERVTPEGCIKGSFITFTRAELENAPMYRGLRGQMAIILDPTLDEDWLRLHIVPLIAGSVIVSKSV